MFAVLFGDSHVVVVIFHIDGQLLQGSHAHSNSRALLAFFIGFDVVFAIIDLILKLIYNYHYRERYFAISFGITLIWTLCTVAAISFYGIFILVANDQGNASYFYGYSGVMEWTACFLYGLVFFILAVDLTRPKVGMKFRKHRINTSSSAGTTLTGVSDGL